MYSMTARPNDSRWDDDDSIDLPELIRRLWEGRRWIIGSTVVLTVLLTSAAFMITPVYRATVVMVPASNEVNDMGGALSSAVGQFGGLAALAGINLGSGDTTEESLAVLRSREFTERFIVDKNLMPKLFPKQWDAAAGKWKTEGNAQPTLARAYKRFDASIRQTARDKKTGLVTMRIDWTDPDEAASWANELIRRLNAEMRKRAIERSDASIAFLEKELASTTLVGMREAIPRLMEAQIKQRMLANVLQEYAFRVVDSAMAPDRTDRVWPNKPVLVAAGLIGGFAIGAVFVLVLASFRRRNKVVRES
jgi:uncharacterized protein involved in exopolysaccharide biosynthesis